MTYKQKLQIEHPESIDDDCWGGCWQCPSHYGYADSSDGLCGMVNSSNDLCTKCWNREIPGTEPMEEETEWRVVDRPPVVGDYIRLKTDGNYTFNRPGDILRVDSVSTSGLVSVYGQNHKRETDYPNYLWNYLNCEYEVVERVSKEDDHPIDTITDEIEPTAPTTTTTTTAPDVVNHPSHYETSKFECIDVMIETQGVEAVKHFCLCNALKYLYRHNRKNGLEDIKKAQWYINKYLELECGQ